MRQASSTGSATLPPLSPPVLRVFEAVSRNCDLPPTITTQNEYIQMLVDVDCSPEQRDRNIANILRAVAEQFHKDRTLQGLMLDQLGFCPERRIFKNSATYLQNESLQYTEETINDIGEVQLFVFLVQFGIATAILPDNQSKVDDMIKNQKVNSLLKSNPEVRTSNTQKRDPLLNALCS